MPEDGAMWFPRCPFEYPYFRLEFFVHDFGLHPPPCAPRERCGYAEITGGLSGPPRVGDEPLSNTPGPGEPFIVNMSTRFGVSTITVTLKNHDDTPVIDDEGAIVSDRVQFTISPDQTNCSWPSGGSSGSMDSGGSGFGGAAGSGEAGEGGMGGA